MYVALQAPQQPCTEYVCKGRRCTLNALHRALAKYKPLRVKGAQRSKCMQHEGSESRCASVPPVKSHLTSVPRIRKFVSFLQFRGSKINRAVRIARAYGNIRHAYKRRARPRAAPFFFFLISRVPTGRRGVQKSHRTIRKRKWPLAPPNERPQSLLPDSH